MDFLLSAPAEIGYVILFLLALVGLPLYATLLAVAVWAFFQSETSLTAIPIEMYRMASSPTLITIPFFTLAGTLLAESRTPDRLIRLSRAALGRLPGGTILLVLVLCAFFTAFTGASGVTIVALGGLLFPILRQGQNSEKFSLGLLTSCGSLGLLFAPSLPIILYGIIAKISIEGLFLSGAVPGVLLIMALYALSLTHKQNRKRIPFSSSELWLALKEARWELPLPFIVLGGIYGGLVTVTEASVLTVAYVAALVFYLNRDLTLTRDASRLIVESMKLVGAILIILICALGLTNYLIDQRVPNQVLEILKEHVDSRVSFLLLLNGFLLLVGGVMDIFSAIIVVLPLILPLAKQFGVDPYHLAVIFLTNLEIGYITPPVGINLFISGHRFKKELPEVFLSTLPFFFVLLAMLMVITFIPELSIWWQGAWNTIGP